MNVVIVGTGYVGLTTGITLAYLGHQVTCLDVDVAKIERLNRGELPIYEPGLADLLAEANGRICFASDYVAAGLDQAEVVFITVGTPSNADGSPDLRFVRQVAQSIGAHLGDADQGQGFTVIVNKSTVPIGSGNWVGSLVRDAYEGAHGHRSDGRFAVASNPEFLREGAAVHDSLYPDRIVLGST